MLNVKPADFDKLTSWINEHVVDLVPDGEYFYDQSEEMTVPHILALVLSFYVKPCDHVGGLLEQHPTNSTDDLNNRVYSLL